MAVGVWEGECGLTQMRRGLPIFPIFSLPQHRQTLPLSCQVERGPGNKATPTTPPQHPAARVQTRSDVSWAGSRRGELNQRIA